MFCFQCGLEIQLDEKPRYNDICPRCDSYLHCCLNCRFYHKTAPNQCREPMAIPQKEKDIAGNCHYFEVRKDKKQVDHRKNMDDARKKLEDLFKKWAQSYLNFFLLFPFLIFEAGSYIYIFLMWILNYDNIQENE